MAAHSVRSALVWADRQPWRWPEKVAIVVVLVVLALPSTGIFGPSTYFLVLEDEGQRYSWAFGLLIGVPLVLWRELPAVTLVLSAGAVLWAASQHISPPFLTTPEFTALAFVAGVSFRGRAAWVVAVCGVLWGQSVYLLTGEENPAFAIFTIPGYIAGVAFRLRRQTSEQLALRSAELEAERELFAELSVRNERARIASELHDVIGHALSVVVVQSAAGQRLVGRDDEAAEAALTAIADSARQGREDLRRLLNLLEGEHVTAPDLSLIDELVARAVASGLDVSCRFEGDRDGIPEPIASVAFRVVQESLTNALRYAPGAAVRVLLHGEGRQLRVLVENDPASGEGTGLRGGGSGLIGLRERIDEVGGSLAYGPTTGGGWSVDADLRGRAS